MLGSEPLINFQAINLKHVLNQRNMSSSFVQSLQTDIST